MIVQLRGKIISKQPPLLVIDVQGVGYEVEAPMSTFYKIGQELTEVCLLTHMIVREDAQLLYGFATEQERLLFRMLIKINGVGPKLGVGILSSIESHDFFQTITNGDEARLVKIPGIGKKTAQRLIIELRDKIPENSDVEHLDIASDLTQSNSNSIEAEAIGALVGLGYKSKDAEKMVKKLRSKAGTTEELIRLSLQSAMGN